MLWIWLKCERSGSADGTQVITVVVVLALWVRAQVLTALLALSHEDLTAPPPLASSAGAGWGSLAGTLLPYYLKWSKSTKL